MLSIVDCHVMFIEAFLAAEAENFGIGSDLGVHLFLNYASFCVMIGVLCVHVLSEFDVSSSLVSY